MKNKYNVTDIIEAINLLLEPNINTKKFTDKLEKPKIEPLKLVNEIKPSENKKDVKENEDKLTPSTLDRLVLDEKRINKNILICSGFLKKENFINKF